MSKLPPRSIWCFNTCGLLCCLHLYVSLCRVSQAEGRPEELGYHNIAVKYYISFLMTAKHRITITKASRIVVISMEDKTQSMRRVHVWSPVIVFYKPKPDIYSIT